MFGTQNQLSTLAPHYTEPAHNVLRSNINPASVYHSRYTNSQPMHILSYNFPPANVKHLRARAGEPPPVSAPAIIIIILVQLTRHRDGDCLSPLSTARSLIIFARESSLRRCRRRTFLKRAGAKKKRTQRGHVLTYIYIT